MPKILNKPEINHSNKIKSPTEKIRQIKNLSFKQQKSHHIFFSVMTFSLIYFSILIFVLKSFQKQRIYSSVAFLIESPILFFALSREMIFTFTI